jgi:hypothetical protein
MRYLQDFTDKRAMVITVVLFCVTIMSAWVGASAILNRSSNLSPKDASGQEIAKFNGGQAYQQSMSGGAATHNSGTKSNSGTKAPNSTTGGGTNTSTGGTSNTSGTGGTSGGTGGGTGGTSGGTGGTGGGTGGTPSTPTITGTYIGACPANPGGESSSAAQTVISKWGTGAAIIQFFGSDITKGPYRPAGASVVHSSYKPSIASVLNGSLDDEIRALIQRTPAGDIIEFYHEPDNDGLSASGIADMIAAKNRLYEIKQQIKPSVLVAATMTGGFFANYTSESKRVPWYGLKADLVGLDADGVHDTTGPTYYMTYADEIAGVKAFMTHGTTWKGWTVPEHGTSRQPWDTTGDARANWFTAQLKLFKDNGAYAVMLYDYNTSAHNTSTNYNQVLAGTPEFTVWANALASSP